MVRIVTSITAVLVCAWALPAAAAPDAEEVLTMLGLSSDARKQVMDGKFITTDIKPTHERELAMAIAFLVRQPPAELLAKAQKNLVAKVDPDSLGRGAITGDGSLDDFAGVSFGSEAKQLTKAYLGAKPGEDLNLSTAEIGAFEALAARGGDAKAVEAELRKLLLARYSAYHSRGLDGIAAYARGGGKQTDVGGELRSAVEVARGLKEHVPHFYDALLNYPNDRPDGLEEDFSWAHYMAHGTPVFQLNHRLWMPDGDAWVMASRQFYVTASYNSVQTLAAFLPVKAGTLVVYLNRTSTDQVGGFGASTKRALGTKVMTSQIEDLFEKARAAAEK